MSQIRVNSIFRNFCKQHDRAPEPAARILTHKRKVTRHNATGSEKKPQTQVTFSSPWSPRAASHHPGVLEIRHTHPGFGTFPIAKGRFGNSGILLLPSSKLLSKRRPWSSASTALWARPQPACRAGTTRLLWSRSTVLHKPKTRLLHISTPS